MSRIGCFFLLSVFTLTVFCCGCDSKVVKVGEQAPPVSGKDIHGNPVSLDALRGKVVVLFFWTNSCCGGTLRDDLEPVFRRNKDKGLAVIAVNELDAEKDVAALAAKAGLSVPILLDPGSALAKKFLVFAFPTSFIVDRNGIVRQKVLGPIPAAKLEQLVFRQFEMQKQAEAAYEKSHHR